jgi:hypothetical protein
MWYLTDHSQRSCDIRPTFLLILLFHKRLAAVALPCSLNNTTSDLLPTLMAAERDSMQQSRACTALLKAISTPQAFTPRHEFAVTTMTIEACAFSFAPINQQDTYRMMAPALSTPFSLYYQELYR